LGKLGGANIERHLAPHYSNSRNGKDNRIDPVKPRGKKLVGQSAKEESWTEVHKRDKNGRGLQ